MDTVPTTTTTTTAAAVFSLPSEVLLSVADHLCLGDLFECNQVCRSWHHVFRYALCHCIDIHDAQSADSLAASSMPIHAVRHLGLSTSVDIKNAGMAAFPWPRLRSLQAPETVFQLVSLECTSLSRLSLSNVQLDKVTPHLSRLDRLQELSLDTAGDLLITDLDHIQHACRGLTSIKLQGGALSSSNLIRHVSPNGQTRSPSPSHSRLTSFAVVFKHADHDAAEPWLTYIATEFPSLRHLALEGRNAVVADGLQQPVPRQDMIVDPAFVACVAVTRLPLVSVRLRYLGSLLRPELYLLLMRGIQTVELEGIEPQLCKEGWLEYMLTHAHTTLHSLSMTMVYPRALCSNPLLRSCQSLRHLTIGRTSGFCSSHGHWQLPLDDILAHAASLASLTLCQVTLTGATDTTHPDTLSSSVHSHLRRLILKGVVVSNHVFQRLAQACPNIDWLEMAGCKWMGSRQQQQGQIPTPACIHLPHHNLRMVDISQSGHLYSLHGYRLLALNGRHWVASTSKGNQRRELNSWRQLKEAHKTPRRCEFLDPSAVPTSESWHHGHLELSYASVQQLYFNGCRIPIPLC